MTTALHKNLPIAEVHCPISFEYASQVARESATGLVANDVRKFARQTDDDSLWMLISYSPVLWVAVGGGTGGTGAKYLFVSALKASAGTIAIGKPVYIAGCSTAPLVELAKADSAGTMPAIGITASQITDSVPGVVILRGRLDGVDTSGWTILNNLYISSATAGLLTTTRPTGTALIQNIAQVVKVDGSAGILCVHGNGLANDLPNLPPGKIWIGDANSYPQSGDVIFGSQLTAAKSDSESSVSGTTAWQQKLSTGALSLPDGTYRIEWYAELKNSSISDDILFRVQRNNTETLGDLNIEGKDNTNYFPVSGFDILTLSAGSHTFDIDYAIETTLMTGYIRRARITVWRMS